MLGVRLKKVNQMRHHRPNYPLHETGRSGLHVLNHRARPARERERSVAGIPKGVESFLTSRGAG